MKIYLLTACTTVLLLLRSLGPEEETLWAPLHTVKVVIHMDQTNREHGGANTSLVNLTVHPVVSEDETDDNELDEGERGSLGITKRCSTVLTSSVGSGVYFSIRFPPYPGIFILY